MQDGPMISMAMWEPEKSCAVSGTIRENLNDREGQLTCAYSCHLVHTWDLFIHTKGSSIMKSSDACKKNNICRQVVDNLPLSVIKILSWYNTLNISCYQIVKIRIWVQDYIFFLRIKKPKNGQNK